MQIHSLIHSLIHSFIHSHASRKQPSRIIACLVNNWCSCEKRKNIAELKFLIYVITSIQHTRRETSDNTPNHMKFALSTHSGSRRSIPLAQINFKANLIKSTSLFISFDLSVQLISPVPFFPSFLRLWIKKLNGKTKFMFVHSFCIKFISSMVKQFLPQAPLILVDFPVVFFELLWRTELIMLKVTC